MFLLFVFAAASQQQVRLWYVRADQHMWKHTSTDPDWLFGKHIGPTIPSPTR
jgi:hypothetical protein